MRVLIPALVLALAAPAWAGASVGAGVPFTAGELDDALAARDGVRDVAVVALAPDRVQVVAGADRWDVALGPARGRDAARVVALHVIERGPPGATLDAPEPPPPPPPRAPSSRGWLTLRLGATRGVDHTDLTAGTFGLDGASPGRIWWGLAMELQADLPHDPDPGLPVDGALYKVSAFTGVRGGGLEAGVGATAGMLIFDGLDLERTYVLGASAQVRQRWPLGRGWFVAATAGATVYDHRVEIRYQGQTVASTPRVSLDGSFGLSRELWR